MTANALEFRNISKSFFGVKALNGVTFSLKQGQTVGLVGENGAGKSTLMNILGGVIPADTGVIELFGKPLPSLSVADASAAGIAFIHQELNLFSNLSIADNLFIDGFPKLGQFPLISKRRMFARANELLNLVELDVSPRTPVKMLTPGERQLVEIARALGRNAGLLIFDEPTTSLTAAERKHLFDIIGRLQRQRKTIIYISHTLEDVLRLADTVAVLRDGRLISSGPCSEYTIERMIAEMVGRRIEQMYPQRKGDAGSRIVLEAANLTEPGIIKDVSLQLREREILGIFGLMGSGRSELARIIFGLDGFRSGMISIKGKPQKKPSPGSAIRKGLAFVTESRREEGLLMDASVSENLDLLTLRSLSRMGPACIVDRSATAQLARETAEKLSIKSGPIHSQPARSLSGGNQQKVVIGKWLAIEPSILILDEPTRGIDVGAKSEIYATINALCDDGAAILFISSEIEELVGVCDRILVMSNGCITGQFDRKEFDKEVILQAAFSGRGTSIETDERAGD